MNATATPTILDDPKIVEAADALLAAERRIRDTQALEPLDFSNPDAKRERDRRATAVYAARVDQREACEALTQRLLTAVRQAVQAERSEQ